MKPREVPCEGGSIICRITLEDRNGNVPKVKDPEVVVKGGTCTHNVRILGCYPTL